MQTECAAFGPPWRHGNLSPCQQRSGGCRSRRRCHHLSRSQVLTTIVVIEIILCLKFLIFPHLLFDHVIPSFQASINFGVSRKPGWCYLQWKHDFGFMKSSSIRCPFSSHSFESSCFSPWRFPSHPPAPWAPVPPWGDSYPPAPPLRRVA